MGTCLICSSRLGDAGDGYNSSYFQPVKCLASGTKGTELNLGYRLSR